MLLRLLQSSEFLLLRMIQARAQFWVHHVAVSLHFWSHKRSWAQLSAGGNNVNVECTPGCGQCEIATTDSCSVESIWTRHHVFNNVYREICFQLRSIKVADRFCERASKSYLWRLACFKYYIHTYMMIYE